MTDTLSHVLWNDEEVGIVEFKSKLWAVHWNCKRQEELGEGNYYQMLSDGSDDSETWTCGGCGGKSIRDGRGFPPDESEISLEMSHAQIKDWVDGWIGLHPEQIEVSIR